MNNLIWCLIEKLDNGFIYVDSKGVFWGSQYAGVSEPFKTFEEAYDWVEAGCT